MNDHEEQKIADMMLFIMQKEMEAIEDNTPADVVAVTFNLFHKVMTTLLVEGTITEHGLKKMMDDLRYTIVATSKDIEKQQIIN